MTAQPADRDAAPATSDREFVMKRLFDAPRELVFRAWSSCEHLSRWWGPTGWTLSACEIDFRAGGSWFYCMAGQLENGEQAESCGKSLYHEIVEPERIVYTDSFVDRAGDLLPRLPEIRSTAEFDAVDGRTRLIIRALFGSRQELEQVVGMGMEDGLRQTLDRLDAYLAELERQ